MNDIATRPLGRTDIQITPIGQGVMQFSGPKGMFSRMFVPLDQAYMNEIIETGYQSGVNWFDTAEIYGRGASESALASALHALDITDESVRIATKWWPLWRTARNIPKTIYERLAALQGYRIDLYQIHQPLSFSSVSSEMAAMADLVAAGHIRSVGVSNFSAKAMRQAHDALAQRGIPLASNQVQYHLLDRRIETNGILDTAKELGITIIAWSPLASGLLTGKFHDDPSLLDRTPVFRRLMLRRTLEKGRPVVDALRAIAAEVGATPAQVALSWVIHSHGDTVVAIPGASKPSHAVQNADAMRVVLSAEQMARLNAVSQPFR